MEENISRGPFAARSLVLLAALFLGGCGGSSNSDSDDGNQAPVANAGGDLSVDAKTDVEITGTGSDEDGSIEGFAWAQTSGPDVTLSGTDGETLSFVAPEVDEVTILAFELQVTDNEGETGTDSVEVEVAPVVTVSGRAYDGPIANAVLTVTVGDRTYTTTADANGDFSLDIGSVDPDAFVVISARGAEGQEHVELTSMAGSFAALSAAAGDDGIVDSEEAGNINVTNVSTAKAVLMLEANNGEPISDDDTMAMLEGNVSGDDLLHLATVIKLVVDGGYDLPEGVESTLSLVQDSETTTSFVESVDADNPSAFDDTFNDILEDGNLVPAFTISNMPSELFTLYVSSNNDKSLTYRVVNRGKTWTFESGGRGTRSDADYASIGFEWILLNGKIVVVYDEPLFSSGWCSHPDGEEGWTYWCESTVYSSTIAMVSDGAQVDTLLISISGDRIFPDDPLEPVELSGGDTNLAFQASAAMPFDAQEMPGRWIASTTGLADEGVADAMLGLIESGYMDFDAGGTGERAATDHSAAEQFSWSITDGVLKVEYVGGDVVRYYRFRRDGDVYDTLALLTRFEGGNHSEAGLMIPVATEELPLITAENLPARYTLFEMENDFSIRFAADGTGSSESYADGVPYDTYPFSWQLRPDHTIEMNYYWDADNGDTAVCTHLESCQGYLDRLWYPAAYNEATSRLYLLEIQQRYEWDEFAELHRGALQSYQPSVRYWGREALSGGEGSMKPMAPHAKARTNRIAEVLGAPVVKTTR